MELFTYIGIIWAIMTVARIAMTKIEIDNQLEQVKEQADRTIRVVQLEQLPDRDLILAYDGENNQFLGQGTTETEVKNRIIERFPEKIFLLNNKVFSAMKLDGLKNYDTSNSR